MRETTEQRVAREARQRAVFAIYGQLVDHQKHAIDARCAAMAEASLVKRVPTEPLLEVGNVWDCELARAKSWAFDTLMLEQFGPEIHELMRTPGTSYVGRRWNPETLREGVQEARARPKTEVKQATPPRPGTPHPMDWGGVLERTTRR